MCKFIMFDTLLAYLYSFYLTSFYIYCLYSLNIQSTLYHGDEGLCMFEPNFKPWGPFVSAEFAVFVPVAELTRIMPWFMRNRFETGTITLPGGPVVQRPEFSVLVHPNTGW